MNIFAMCTLHFNLATVLRSAILLPLLLLLYACSSGISVTYTPPVEAESAFEYLRKIKTLPAPALAAELEILEQDIQSRADAASTVKLALLLSWQEQAESANDNAAIGLLQSLQASAQHANLSIDYQVLSEHWLALLLQRQKAREYSQLYQQTQATLQELQESYGQLDGRYLDLARVMASLERQNTLLATQNVLMQQQIEALTVIEQQLAAREQEQGQE